MLELSKIKGTSGNVLQLLRLLNDQLLAVERHLGRLLRVRRRLDRLGQALEAMKARARVAAATVARFPALAGGGGHFGMLQHLEFSQKCATTLLVAADVGFEFFDDGAVAVAAIGGEDVGGLGHQRQLLRVLALLDVLRWKKKTCSLRRTDRCLNNWPRFKLSTVKYLFVAADYRATLIKI